MPLKNGRLTPQERLFVQYQAATGDPTYSAAKAGYGSPQQRGSQNMSNPAIVEEVRRRVDRGMADMAPTALETIRDNMTAADSPRGIREKAAEFVLNWLRKDAKAGERKDPSEMTAQELADRRLELEMERVAIERVQSDNAKPIIEVEPVDDRRESPENGAFG